jgi:V8-like Glu-specific endopeptidase
MMITLSNRMVAAVAGAAIVVGAQALAPLAGATTAANASHPADAGHVAGAAILQDAVSTSAQAAAVRYWTRARMAAALEEPVSRLRHLLKDKPAKAPARTEPWLTGDTAGFGLRWTHGGAAANAVGKIFFTLGHEDYACSGTLVRGEHADVILTAAHCVTGGFRRENLTQWATNWIFVPGFSDGSLPYGEYTARRFFVTPDWTGPDSSAEQYDVAFVQVTTATLYGGTGPAQPPTGLPVEFAGSQDAATASRAYVFGYPSEAPYTGLYPNYCAGPVAASGGSLRTPCGMTAGDSGGPWLAGFSPRSGLGTVVAVTTYKVSDNLRVLYGAVLGPQARVLYERAVSSAR